MKVELSKIEPYCSPALRAFVRAVRMEDGAVWFTGGDLCKTLLLSNPVVALHSLDHEERRTALLQEKDGDYTLETLVSESGLLVLVGILTMHGGPALVSIRKWIAKEMLPAVHGYRLGRQEAERARRPSDRRTVSLMVRSICGMNDEGGKQ